MIGEYNFKIPSAGIVGKPFTIKWNWTLPKNLVNSRWIKDVFLKYN